MTEPTRTVTRQMNPREWYSENRLSFWEVFDVESFHPTIDGFTNLAVDECQWARSKGVYLNGPELAVFLMCWWRKTTLLA